jgi:hypothetical protein
MSFEQPHLADSQPTPERPPLNDVITEPDAARLTGYRDQYRVDRGKFIRIGTLVLLAPLIPDTDTARDQDWQHLDMIWAAYQHDDPEMQSKVREAADNADSEPFIRDNGKLTDAGHYYLRFGAEGTLERLIVDGDSFKFGRAKEAGRQRTADLIQEKMGPEIGVQLF